MIASSSSQQEKIQNTIGKFLSETNNDFAEAHIQELLNLLDNGRFSLNDELIAQLLEVKMKLLPKKESLSTLQVDYEISCDRSRTFFGLIINKLFGKSAGYNKYKLIEKINELMHPNEQELHNLNKEISTDISFFFRSLMVIFPNDPNGYLNYANLFGVKLDELIFGKEVFMLKDTIDSTLNFKKIGDLYNAKLSFINQLKNRVNSTLRNRASNDLSSEGEVNNLINKLRQDISFIGNNRNTCLRSYYFFRRQFQFHENMQQRKIQLAQMIITTDLKIEASKDENYTLYLKSEKESFLASMEKIDVMIEVDKKLNEGAELLSELKNIERGLKLKRDGYPLRVFKDCLWGLFRTVEFCLFALFPIVLLLSALIPFSGFLLPIIGVTIIGIVSISKKLEFLKVIGQYYGIDHLRDRIFNLKRNIASYSWNLDDELQKRIASISSLAGQETAIHSEVTLNDQLGQDSDYNDSLFFSCKSSTNPEQLQTNKVISASKEAFSNKTNLNQNRYTDNNL